MMVAPVNGAGFAAAVGNIQIMSIQAQYAQEVGLVLDKAVSMMAVEAQLAPE